MIHSFHSRKQRRRATTAMEYLFMLSLIIVVAMMGIGYFGQSTKEKMQNNDAAINNAVNR
jgi:uncharacterized protein (UPF0333 family)